MSDKIKSILKDIIADHKLDCKRINSSNLEMAGTLMQYGTPHRIMYYTMRNIKTQIYMEYDEYRGLARNVMVYDI